MSKQLEEAKKLLLFGDSPSAQKVFKNILKKDPNNFEALHGLSLSFFQQKKYDAAERFLLQAVKTKKSDPELYNSLGIVYQKSKSWQKAGQAFLQAKQCFENRAKFRQNPKYRKTLSLLAGVYIMQQEFVEAKNILRKLLKLDPCHFDALRMLAQVYVGLLQYHLAIKTLEKLPIDPAVLEAFKVEVFLLKKDYPKALKSAKQCVKLNPQDPHFYSLLGECYIKALQLDKSIEVFKKGLELDPCHFKMLSRLLALQVRVCDWKGRRDIIGRLRSLSANDKSGDSLAVIQPTTAILTGFTNEEIQKIAAAHCEILARLAVPVRERLNFTYKRTKSKKLKVGYLSSDFHTHATAHLMLDVFGLHNRKKFEIFAYSYGVNDKSPFRKRIASDCDHFIEIGKMSDTAAAQKINDDGIDILVDLKGHIVDHRLGILALRPSPVQVHYLGYPGTIGASFVDYIIADRYVIPKSERKYYSESIVYMPVTYQANTATKHIPKKKPTKKDYGIPEDVFVFCCFNQNDKLDTETMKAWMKILQSVPKSVLWQWGNYGNLKKKLSAYAKEHGVDSKRFIVSPTEPYPKHLARMGLASIFLDTFYYSAHTSCSDALFVGLPVLTCPGKTFASRVAANLLKNVKASELIAKSRDDYIAKAIELANNPGKLKRIQEKIVKNRDASQIYDPEFFTKRLDEAYLKMWERYQDGKPPKDITIPR